MFLKCKFCQNQFHLAQMLAKCNYRQTQKLAKMKMLAKQKLCQTENVFNNIIWKPTGVALHDSPTFYHYLIHPRSNTSVKLTYCMSLPTNLTNISILFDTNTTFSRWSTTLQNLKHPPSESCVSCVFWANI